MTWNEYIESLEKKTGPFTDSQKAIIKELLSVPYTYEEIEYLEPYIRKDYSYDELYDVVYDFDQKIWKDWKNL